MKGMRIQDESKIFLLMSKVMWFSACEVFVVIKLMDTVLLGVDAALGDGCRVWEHLHSFRENKFWVISRLYAWDQNKSSTSKSWTWCKLLVSNLEDQTLIWLGGQSLLQIFVSRSSGGMKFCYPSWGPSSVAVRMEYLICLSILRLWNLCGKPVRGRKDALFS